MLSHTWKRSGYRKFLKELSRVRRLRLKRLQQRYTYETKIESLKKNIDEKNRLRRDLMMSRKLLISRRRRRWRLYRRMRSQLHRLQRAYTNGLANLDRVRQQLAKMKKERLRYVRLLRAIRIPRLPKYRMGKNPHRLPSLEQTETEQSKKPTPPRSYHPRRMRRKRAHRPTRNAKTEPLPEVKSEKSNKSRKLLSKKPRKRRGPREDPIPAQDQQPEAGQRGRRAKRRRRKKRMNPDDPSQVAELPSDSQFGKKKRKKPKRSAQTLENPTLMPRSSQRRSTRPLRSSPRIPHIKEKPFYMPENIDQRHDQPMDRGVKVTKYLEADMTDKTGDDSATSKAATEASRGSTKKVPSTESLTVEKQSGPPPEQTKEHDEWIRQKLAKLRQQAELEKTRASTNTLYSIPSNRHIYNEKYVAIQRAISQSEWHRKRSQKGKGRDGAVSGRGSSTSVRGRMSTKRRNTEAQKSVNPLSEDSGALGHVRETPNKKSPGPNDEHVITISGLPVSKAAEKALRKRHPNTPEESQADDAGHPTKHTGHPKHKRRMSEEIRTALQRYEAMRNVKTPQLDAEDNAHSLAKLPLQAVSVHSLLQDPRMMSRASRKGLLADGGKPLLKKKDLKEVLNDLKKATGRERETEKKKVTQKVAEKVTVSHDTESVKEDSSTGKAENASDMHFDSSLMPTEDSSYTSTVTYVSNDDVHPEAVEEPSGSDTEPVRMSTLMQLRRSRRESYDRMVNAQVKRSSSLPPSLGGGRWDTKAQHVPGSEVSGLGMRCCKPDTDTSGEICNVTPKQRARAAKADDDDADDRNDCVQRHNLA